MTKLPFIPAMENAAGAAAAAAETLWKPSTDYLASSFLFPSLQNTSQTRITFDSQSTHFFVCAKIKNPPSNPELKSRIERFMAISSAKGDLFPLPQQLLQVGFLDSVIPILPEIVKAGDPVLHEPACEVDIEEIGSEKIEKIIQNTISVMRKALGVGLAAPQIGIPLKVLISSSKCHHVTSNGYFISLQQTR